MKEIIIYVMVGKLINEIKKEDKISVCIKVLFNIVFFSFLLLGMYITFKMNKTGRTLWYDEAALAYSMSQRSLSELTKTGLDMCQSAPVIWLYLVKITIILLGNTEFTLRLMSSFAYIGTVIVIYFISKHILNNKNALGAAAFVAMIPYFVRYSNVFKPYEFDALCVCLVIISYWMYISKKIGPVVLGFIWAILVWCSNPTCFFEGGFLLVYSLKSIIEKNKANIGKSIIIAIFVASSFITYYLYWLSQSVGYMQDYWEGAQFPLIPLTVNDIKLVIDDIKFLFSAFEGIWLIVFILDVICIIGSILKKQHILIGILIGFIISLFASFIGFFPISDRLWIFAYPLWGLMAINGLELAIDFAFSRFNDKNGHNIRIIFCSSIIIIVLIVFGRGWRYLYTFNHYWLFEELNSEIEYVQNNIEDGEVIFLHTSTFFGYNYKTDYGRREIFDNAVILSTGNIESDIDIISQFEKCYILSTHYSIYDVEEPCNIFIEELKKTGFVQLVNFEHKTPVYYYCSDLKDMKDEVNPDDIWY